MHWIVILSGLTVLVIIFLGTAHHGYQRPGGFLLYNNTDYEFQFQYPRDWGIIEAGDKPGDFVTRVVTVESISEQDKHFTKKFVCGEVCPTIQVDDTGKVGNFLSPNLTHVSKDMMN